MKTNLAFHNVVRYLGVRVMLHTAQVCKCQGQEGKREESKGNIFRKQEKQKKTTKGRGKFLYSGHRMRSCVEKKGEKTKNENVMKLTAKSKICDLLNGGV